MDNVVVYDASLNSSSSHDSISIGKANEQSDSAFDIRDIRSIENCRHTDSSKYLYITSPKVFLSTVVVTFYVFGVISIIAAIVILVIVLVLAIADGKGSSGGGSCDCGCNNACNDFTCLGMCRCFECCLLMNNGSGGYGSNVILYGSVD